METLAQQVADLQDEAEGREDAHSERVAALQATIERLSGEADTQSESRAAELEAKCAALEEQACHRPLTTLSAAEVSHRPSSSFSLGRHSAGKLAEQARSSALRGERLR